MGDCIRVAGLGRCRERAASSQVLNSVHHTYASIVRRSTIDALPACHAIVAAISRPHMAGHVHATSRLSHIPPCTLRLGMIKRQSLDARDGALWASSVRAPWSDRLLDDDTRSFIE